MEFEQMLREEFIRQTGEEPYWFTNPDGSKKPESKKTHLERAKKLRQVIDSIRPVTQGRALVDFSAPRL